MRHLLVRLTALVAVALLLSVRPLAGQTTLPRLAPGVLKVVPAEPEEADTTTGPRPIPALAAATKAWESHFDAETETLFELSRKMTLRRPVWQLEFAFKTMRMTTVEIPDEQGNPQPRKVWYLVYRLRNLGTSLEPLPKKDAFDHDQYTLRKVYFPVRFLPVFRLRSHEQNRVYIDQVLPTAVERIHQIEIRDPQVRLYDSVSITAVPIEVSTDTADHSVWGVATWVDVDPRIDFFSVFAQGLTNAYRWEDQGPDAQPRYKTLVINFWRPGDAVDEHQGEFRYGLPAITDEAKLQEVLRLYGVDQPQAFRWVYMP